MSDMENAWDNSIKIARGNLESKKPQEGLQIGNYNHLVAVNMSDYGLYLGTEEDKILLPNKHVPEEYTIGDTLEVFVYTDSEDRLVATTLKPAGLVGEFVFLEAKELVPFGTFMDWGLEKDLLVPKMEQQEKMVPGKKYLTKICLDTDTQRLYGTTKISVNCDKNTEALNAGQQVSLIIHSITNIGVMAVVDNQYYGMLYLNEIYQDLAVGDILSGYIMRLREDKKIDLTLKKPGYTSVEGSAKKIFDIMEKAGGFIPCHDKSAPEEIKQIFSMSKKEFKRAIGGMYKKGVIQLEKDGIRLK